MDHSIFRRLISPFQEFGLLCGLLYALDRLLLRLSPYVRVFVYELMVQPISPTPILPRRLASKLAVRVLELGDPDLSAVIAPESIQRTRFAQDAICLATYSDGRLIGYVWLSFERYEEDEARCTFVVNPAGQAAFDFDLVVLPEYRMGLGFAGLWHSTNDYLHSRGIACTFSRITRFNLASRRAHARLGARRVGQTVIFKFWSVEIIASTIAPYIYISPNPMCRARIRLYPTPLSK